MGQDDVWIGIYRESVRDLYAFVSRRTGGERQLAEDVTQEAFLRAVTHHRNGRTPREPLAWLKTVARNLLVSHYRRRAAVPTDPASLDRLLAAAGPESGDEAALLVRGLAAVGRKHRAVLEAFHLDGKSQREIAEETGLSERAVEGRLRRGREALAKKLKGAVQ